MPPWDETFDLVVIGSGGGSMCAALAAHACGKRPLIIEKQAKIGGTSGYSGGIMWLPDNPVSRRAGVEDSFALSRRYMDAVIGEAGPASSPQRRDAYVRESPLMVEFLERKGMKFVHSEWCDYHDDKPGGLVRGRSIHSPLFNLKELGEYADRLSVFHANTVPMNIIEGVEMMLIRRTWKSKRLALKLAANIVIDALTGKKRRGWGAALQGRMLQISLRERIPIWTETPVRDLIVEEGRVVGLLAEHKGQTLRIRANEGVLINAGGFSRNQAMRDHYQRKPISSQWTSVDPGHTGEMQRAAIGLGAAVAQMEQAVWNITSLHFDGSLPPGVPVVNGIAYPFPQPYDISKPHGIMVDQTGQRFFDEAVSYIEQVNKMYDRHETVPAVPSWHIMDSRHRNQYFWAGSPPGVTPKAWIDSGYMKKADTLENLAHQCGIEPATLQATVERFNGFCQTGIDEDFHRGENGYARFIGDPTYKPNPSIGSIERPPFYAVAMFPHDVGTYGGLVTDEFARVLRTDGSVIEGLYATGTSAASVMGKTYPGAGASVGPSFVWGWVAACHACGRPQ